MITVDTRVIEVVSKFDASGRRKVAHFRDIEEFPQEARMLGEQSKITLQSGKMNALMTKLSGVLIAARTKASVKMSDMVKIG